MVRRTNRSSAGKLSGSNYTAMQAWFFAADTLAEQLTELFNRIAASQVPAPIVPLLTAGRGAAIPKPGGAGLRPVAVGSILMRFVGTLALIKKSAEISVFFLGPRPLKFAVGLELELELVQSHMAQKPVLRGEVGCACAAREVSVERDIYMQRTFAGSRPSSTRGR